MYFLLLLQFSAQYNLSEKAYKSTVLKSNFFILIKLAYCVLFVTGCFLLGVIVTPTNCCVGGEEIPRDQTKTYSNFLFV